MKLSHPDKITLGFGLALGLLAAIVIAAFLTTTRLKATARSAARALHAVETANGLHKRVELAKAGVSDYLLTGERKHLLVRRANDHAVGLALAGLRGQHPWDRDEQRRLDSFESLLRRVAVLNDRFVAARDLRELTPLDLLAFQSEEDRLLWQIHRKIDDDIESGERSRLAGSVARARSFAAFSMLASGVGGFAGIAIVFAAALVTVRDARARLSVESRLEHQASHDALTGLPNRSLLQRHLEENIRSARANGGSFALLLMDLDRFKKINDTHGHHYGDEVLRELSPRLRAALRSTDLAARLGGDEFAVLLPGAVLESAVPVAEWIILAVCRPIEVSGRRLEVGASLGIAMFPEHGQDASSLLRQADLAMYASKRSGGHQAVSVAGRLGSDTGRIALAIQR